MYGAVCQNSNPYLFPWHVIKIQIKFAWIKIAFVDLHWYSCHKYFSRYLFNDTDSWIYSLKLTINCAVVRSTEVGIPPGQWALTYWQVGGSSFNSEALRIRWTVATYISFYVISCLLRVLSRLSEVQPNAVLLNWPRLFYFSLLQRR